MRTQQVADHYKRGSVAEAWNSPAKGWKRPIRALGGKAIELEFVLRDAKLSAMEMAE